MQKSTKAMRGFGAIELILILVVVGLVGFVGWTIYQANTTKTSTPAPATTEELSQYKNEAENFSLSYPKSWGEATAINTDELAYTYLKSAKFAFKLNGLEYAVYAKNTFKLEPYVITPEPTCSYDEATNKWTASNGQSDACAPTQTTELGVTFHAFNMEALGFSGLKTVSFLKENLVLVIRGNVTAVSGSDEVTEEASTAIKNKTLDATKAVIKHNTTLFE